jgi:iron complex transport system permease protein
LEILTVSQGTAVTIGLGAAVAALALASLFLGYAPLSAGDVMRGLMGEGGTAAIVVQEIRVPRALLAILIGGALGLGGAALQGLMRNPLAEPGVIGVSAAASLGAVGAMYYGLAAAWPYALPVMAMAGAGLATLFLLFVSARGGILSLILAGVAVSSLCAALTSVALNLSPNAYASSEIVYWLLGSLRDRGMEDVALAAPFVLVGCAIVLAFGRQLDALALGDDAARSLGVSVPTLSAWIVAGVALAVGASVGVAGAIGFVGLIVPHVLRPWVGHRPSSLLLPSALGGAALLTAADIAVRIVPSPNELMLGVMTAMIGAPFFFWLIFRNRSNWT